ncbi:hypothetical protein APA_4841 [Pseudanabaena sp. lw0831]|nr:hypothetical protein APA_4841 [Pseudanabaena sp. lw0831]
MKNKQPKKWQDLQQFPIKRTTRIFFKVLLRNTLKKFLVRV